MRATKTKGDTHLVSDAAVGAGQRSRCRQGRRRLHGRRRRLWMGRFLFFFLLPLDADDGQSRGCRWRHRHRRRMDVGTRGVSVVVADADRRRIRLAAAIGARVRPESGADCETLLADLAPAAIGRLLPHSFWLKVSVRNRIKKKSEKQHKWVLPWQTGQQAPGWRRALLAGQGKTGHVRRVQTIEPWVHWHWVHGSFSGSGVTVWPSAIVVSLFHRHPNHHQTTSSSSIDIKEFSNSKFYLRILGSTGPVWAGAIGRQGTVRPSPSRSDTFDVKG